jgi:RNA polymerase sigma factor (sigma-70 family)
VIYAVDDDASFRAALERLLQSAGFRVAPCTSAQHLLEELAETKPDSGCILLDVRLPGLSGLDVQTLLAEKGNVLPIIFLSAYGDIPMSVRALKAGAEDFLPKPVSKKVLFTAIQRALARYERESEQTSRLRSLRALADTLTPRQREVFALIVAGKLNKQIAYELGTSERTIKAHRQAAMAKLKARSLAEAVSIAAQLRD